MRRAVDDDVVADAVVYSAADAAAEDDIGELEIVVVVVVVVVVVAVGENLTSAVEVVDVVDVEGDVDDLPAASRLNGIVDKKLEAPGRLPSTAPES